MTLAGIPMRVVGRDATPMRGRDGTDTSYSTNTINIGPGESYDVIFTRRPPKAGSGPYDTYMLYNRAFLRSNNLAPGGFGGQATEIRVYPSGVGDPQDIRTTGEFERHEERKPSHAEKRTQRAGTAVALLAILALLPAALSRATAATTAPTPVQRVGIVCTGEAAPTTRSST